MFTCSIINMTFSTDVLQPHLVNKLLIEDVAPKTSKTLSNSGIPTFIAAMKAVKFDDSLGFNAQRRSVSKQLRPTFQVSFLEKFLTPVLSSGPVKLL